MYRQYNNLYIKAFILHLFNKTLAIDAYKYAIMNIEIKKTIEVRQCLTF